MVILSEIGSNLSLGISVALSYEALLYCFIGVSLGTLVGVLPGIGTIAAISLLLPITFYLEPTIALIMLAGIYYGSAYGGSTASILLNLPGTASSAVTCLDGYPMAKNGRAGVALFITAIASFVGSFFGLLMLAAFSPPLAAIAMRFGSPEYFSLMILGLVAATLLASGNPFRATAAVTLGLLLGIVGIDINSGQSRFTFGFIQLQDGLPLVAIALGLFGLSEVIANAGSKSDSNISLGKITFASMFPKRDEWRRSWRPMARGAGVGSFFGALPGTGGLIASFMSYALEKKIHKRPDEFGKGAIEGVAGPESANNAGVQTAFIPTLTLGIPGDAVMALMLGALMIHGVTPGPGLLTSNPSMFWGLVVSFLVGNLMLLILNIPLIGLWVRILKIPYDILFPCIVVFVCIGVYSVNFAVSDLIIVIIIGALGYIMFLLRFEPAPLILGFVLGPLLEENLRRSMVLSRGNAMIFFERPLSGTFMALALALILFMIFSKLRSLHKLRE